MDHLNIKASVGHFLTEKLGPDWGFIVVGLFGMFSGSAQKNAIFHPTKIKSVKIGAICGLI
ncbi:MAG: hypothetical protein D6814_18355 [Calditrichaeota bacterium]|nr:MAG: hypothetical protein D6814_18355 [Calditrichota bacterium]